MEQVPIETTGSLPLNHTYHGLLEVAVEVHRIFSIHYRIITTPGAEKWSAINLISEDSVLYGP